MIEGLGFQPSRYYLVVVDDEKAMLAVLKLALEQQGYAPIFFNTPGEALEQIKGNPVDLLITDFHMPGMDGLSLVRKCREAGWNGSVVVMSGRLHTVPMVALNELGVCEFLEKPFSPLLMGKTLQSILTGIPL